MPFPDGSFGASNLSFSKKRISTHALPNFPLLRYNR
jgi:hypothetical protein